MLYFFLCCRDRSVFYHYAMCRVGGRFEGGIFVLRPAGIRRPHHRDALRSLSPFDTNAPKTRERPCCGVRCGKVRSVHSQGMRWHNHAEFVTAGGSAGSVGDDAVAVRFTRNDAQRSGVSRRASTGARLDDDNDDNDDDEEHDDVTDRSDARERRLLGQRHDAQSLDWIRRCVPDGGEHDDASDFASRVRYRRDARRERSGRAATDDERLFAGRHGDLQSSGLDGERFADNVR